MSAPRIGFCAPNGGGGGGLFEQLQIDSLHEYLLDVERRGNDKLFGGGRAGVFSIVRMNFFGNPRKPV